jgi:hypothetical protein
MSGSSCDQLRAQMQQLRAQFMIMDEALRKGCGPKANDGLQLPATDTIPPINSLTGSSSLAGGSTLSGVNAFAGNSSAGDISSLLSGILG